jgi:hypothetical protein
VQVFKHPIISPVEAGHAHAAIQTKVLVHELNQASGRQLPICEPAAAEKGTNHALTVSLSLYLDSKTNIAARDPEPIVAKGREDPYG